MDKFSELSYKTPYWDDVYDSYNPQKEDFREQNYQMDLRLIKLKQSLLITQIITFHYKPFKTA